MQPDALAADTVAAAPAPVKFDPLASFLTTRAYVDLGGATFEIEIPPARYWLTTFLDEPPFDWGSILPGLLAEEDQIWVEERMFAGEITAQEVLNATYALTGEIAGCKWWVALALCSIARAAWDRVGGEAVRDGLTRVDEITFGAWVVGIFSIIMDKIDPKQAARFVSELTRPPEGFEDEFDPEDEEDAFMAAMSMM